MEGHHEDYDFPLQVIWLCQAHHRRLTYKQRKQANTLRDSTPPIKPDAAYMSLKQTAAHYGVSTKTIMKWIETGKLESIQPAGPNGRILIPR